MDKFDCVIIGGGIVGLSVAWRILEKRHCRLAVLEKEESWAQHQTGRHSGVNHSGIYYRPGSLKAKLCREGNRSMVEFCENHGVRYETCGKLIVATEASELPMLENLYQRGAANGLAVSKLTVSGLDEMHRSFSKKAFVRSLQKLIPEIREEDLVPGAAGVRAQALRPDGGLVGDFLIVNSASGMHVCNAPSPAATASLEIGRLIAEQIPANPWDLLMMPARNAAEY